MQSRLIRIYDRELNFLLSADGGSRGKGEHFPYEQEIKFFAKVQYIFAYSLSTLSSWSEKVFISEHGYCSYSCTFLC